MNHCCACNFGDVSRGQFCSHEGGIYLCKLHENIKMVRASEITRLLGYDLKKNNLLSKTGGKDEKNSI